MNIRHARESDADDMRDVFLACYGKDYVYPEYCDVDALRRMILGEDSITMVAENPKTGRVVGTASVIVEVGGYSDLLGEFGRLAVSPRFRGRGIGRLLMEGRLRSVEDRLHVALVDARTEHPYSQRIALTHGFHAVGFCPLKDQFSVRESTGMLARFFGDALTLRRRCPRIVPEVQEIAALALEGQRLPVDPIIDTTAGPYPHESDYQIETLATPGYSTLLRIERGRVRHREVFGPVRLHYGPFKLRSRHASYLVARHGGQVAGAIGYIHNDAEQQVRVFELIARDDGAIWFLLAELERRARREWHTAYIEIDVAADAPRLQRTLLSLRFVPVAYIPAMVFHEVERLDVVRMVRLLVPLELGKIRLTREIRAFADTVIAALRPHDTRSHIESVLHRSPLFRGLSEEQSRDLAAICEIETYPADTEILHEGAPCDALHVVLEGKVAVGRDNPPRELASFCAGVGDILDESSLLLRTPYRASATAQTPVRAARVRYSDLDRLVRERPNIGVAMYRNLATGLAADLANPNPSSVPESDDDDVS